MKLKVKTDELSNVSCDVLVVPLRGGSDALKGDAAILSPYYQAAIAKMVENGEFNGKANETAVIHLSGVPRKLVLVGLGAAASLTTEKIRQAAGAGMRTALKGNVASVAVSMTFDSELDPVACAQAVVEGGMLAAYRFDRLKSDAKALGLAEIVVAVSNGTAVSPVQQGVDKGVIMAEATMLARDLVNLPGNMMTPTHMAEAAQKIAFEGGLSCEVLEENDMQALGMGALLGVSQGSAQPAKLIVLKYEGSTPDEVLALVGKGLTFDSGGISLKPGEGMHLMKNDMSGGAAVLCAMKAIGHLKPARSVLGIVACSENLPSGTALKPGDVVTAMNGKTIEILNTDAEGRLILADAVAYAVTLGAKRIVDAATLTGACGVALGPNIYSAVVANDDALVADIMQAAALAGERFWRMPGDDDYKELFKSTVADLQNTGGRLGGVMTGGLFIGEFVGETPWAHLDIAPTAFADKEKHYQGKGATGVAVRTLAELACL